MTHYERCPQLHALPSNIQQFWEEKQQECGEQLLLFSYAVFMGTLESPSPDKSGILYVMERNLWFEDFQKAPFFLFAAAATYKKTLIQIPRPSITKVELITKSGLDLRLHGKTPRTGALHKLFSLFTSDPAYFCVAQKQTNGEITTYLFREVNEPEAWIQACQNQVS